jgi:ribosome-associated protein
MDVKKASLMQSYEDSRKLALEIASFLDEKKAKDIITIDISSKTPIADYFVICSAKSTTAVKALTEYVDEMLSKRGIEPKGRDIDAKWSAVDYGSVILHVFYEETRQFYQLERLWDNGENITKIHD